MKSKSHPMILGFYGKSNIGKTTLIEKLISDLASQGYSIAAVKRTDKPINVDTPGKDTARFSRAGAKSVVLSTPSGTTYFVQTHSEEKDIINHLQSMDGFDFIFIEGAHEEQIPKIRLGRIKKRLNTIFTYNGDYSMLFEKLQSDKLKELLNGKTYSIS